MIRFKNLDVSTWFCLFFLFARTILDWWPVYDCKAYLETNTVNNCSYFGFGGYFLVLGTRHLPSLVPDQEFKVTVGNPKTQECETPCTGVPVTSLCESYPLSLFPPDA